MVRLQTNAIYEIELCSGERRRWQYLGAQKRADEQGLDDAPVWWRDVENGSEFNEASLLYAWKIVAPAGLAD